MRIVILGPPGSGKGTVAGEISSRYHLVHISTGALFRAHIREGTEIGKEAKTYIDRGDLVPDSVTIEMLKDRVAKVDCEEGFLLDGYPRTVPQADALEHMLAEKGQTLDIALNVHVPEQLIIERLAGRRICTKCGLTYNIFTQPSKQPLICDNCGSRLVQREDDTDETIHHRLMTYEAATTPLIDYYTEKGILKEVDNSGSVESTMAEVKKVFSDS